MCNKSLEYHRDGDPTIIDDWTRMESEMPRSGQFRHITIDEKEKRCNAKRRGECEREPCIPTSWEWSKRKRHTHNYTKQQNEIVSLMRAL
ncbi:hypothetical protein EVAR_40182_1 [Eumeta japonica]|uniref:Uncharacterized protein n=1 Tax=Eumeta variegata TaxID=151549 RepID=A0A4C1XJH5_EUMVA|nr:hypothetical protein EVAR_40182_1 [Eumeta japonica]